MMKGWHREENSHNSRSTKQRGRSGKRVQLEGMYENEWGDGLLLMQGDIFPAHPYMGDTVWTYKGSIIQSQRGALPRSDHRKAAGEMGFPK
ncbi:hypothetical protein ACX1C1_13955 [Paenibacillus sp. strain BS8-2]